MAAKATQTQRVISEIPIAEIKPSLTNPRKTFDLASLRDLEASIQAAGIHTPLVVRKFFVVPGDDLVSHFELVAGARRLEAAKRAGLETVPCEIRELNDEQARELQIVENLQRDDVHPMEEAEAYRALGVEHPEDIARRVGKTAAYVAQRLKLLDLLEPAQLLFGERHMTLEHALILATLGAADQEKALRHMIDIGERWKDKPLAEVVDARRKDYTQGLGSEDGAARLIRISESELRGYVRTNVMLDLGKAPWSLDDAELVPEAGACATCPKRTGGNPALFAELTAEENQCTDAACFELKHKTFVQITTERAKEAGEPLLKLSAKHGQKKLPEPLKETLTFRKGQWVKAEAGSCPAVRKGILVDDSGRYADEELKAGTVLTVCVDQRCKVHKHSVDSLSGSSGGAKSGAKAESWEERQAREKKEADAIRAIEGPVLRAVYDACAAAVLPKHQMLNTICAAHAMRHAQAVASVLGIQVKGGQQAAGAAVSEYIAKCSLDKLHAVAFHAHFADELDPSDWILRERRKEVRIRLWDAAKHLGVDAVAIAKRVEKELAAAKPAEAATTAATPDKPRTAKKSAAKPVAAKPVAKKKGLRSKPVKLSPAAKKKIADNMKKRWAANRKTAKKAVAK